MNDISVILSKIEEDAKQVAAGILATAEEKCKQTEDEYVKLTEQQRKVIMADAEAQVNTIKLRSASQSGIQERNANLTTRRESMDTAFEKALQKLCAMPDERKIAFYTNMVSGFATEDAEMILNAADRDAFGTAIVSALNAVLPNGKIQLSSTVGAFRGGIVLKQGSVETNCTFEVLISRAKDDLEPDVAHALFN